MYITFEGIVTDQFGKILINNSTFETDAVSVLKGLSNINYQAKRRLGLDINTRIYLNGRLFFENSSYMIKNNKIQDEHIEFYDETYSIGCDQYRLIFKPSHELNQKLRLYLGDKPFYREEFDEALKACRDQRIQLRGNIDGEHPYSILMSETRTISETTLIDDLDYVWSYHEDYFENDYGDKLQCFLV